MKLKLFRGKGIHSTYDLQIPFKNDITFLTGINGSGKTTALNCIVSLLSPDLEYLASIQYTSLSLQYNHNNQAREIKANRSNVEISLMIDNIDEPLNYEIFERNAAAVNVIADDTP